MKTFFGAMYKIVKTLKIGEDFFRFSPKNELASPLSPGSEIVDNSSRKARFRLASLKKIGDFATRRRSQD